MKSTYYTLLAVVFYAIANIAIDRWLKDYSATSILIWWYSVMILMSLVTWSYFHVSDQPLVSPEGITAIGITCLVGMVYFLADITYISAYTNGGSVFSISTIFISFPVVAGAIKMIIVKELPTPYQIAGYIFVAIGVYFFVKGEKAPSQVIL